VISSTLRRLLSFPSESFAIGASWSVVQFPSTTNCRVGTGWLARSADEVKDGQTGESSEEEKPKAGGNQENSS
jgi:hypothetical protein